MAITIPSLDTLEAQVLAYFRVQFPGRDLGPESYIGKWSKALALALWGVYKSIEDADRDGVPSSLTSSARLDEFAALFGLSNGAGSYGRKGAIAATGGQGPAAYAGAGPFPFTVSAGATLTGSDGVTSFSLAADLVYAVPGSLTATIDAVTAGTAGNLAAAAVLTWTGPPAGLASTVTLSTGLSGGTARESDADLLQRLLLRLQQPPKGGTASDYRAWAEGETTVQRAYVYPRRHGTGTVDVVITKAGSGTARGTYTAGELAAVDAALEVLRPVAVESCNTMVPNMPGANGLTLRARVVPSVAKYAWSWDDLAAAYPTVKAGGTVGVLWINGSAPAALAAAVTAGSRPYIQVANTTAGHAVKADCVRVSSITAGADDHLNLETNLSVYPTAGDTVYAGGPIVSAIQGELIASVDAAGPSRSSGYADPDDGWNDTVSVSQLIHKALDAVDSDGIAYADNFLVSAGAPQMLINGAVADYQPTDSSLTTGPEMAYCKLVLVTS